MHFLHFVYYIGYYNVNSLCDFKNSYSHFPQHPKLLTTASASESSKGGTGIPSGAQSMLRYTFLYAIFEHTLYFK